MAYKCEVCGKGPRAGKSVSHAHKASNRFFYPNLFSKKVLLNGMPKKAYVCSICLKSEKVQIA